MNAPAEAPADLPRPSQGLLETSPQANWQEHQVAADAAWDQALERTKILRPEANENPAPLDETTIRLYEQAARHLKAMIFLGPDGPTDPFTLLKLGGSQAALAEATPVGVFYESGGRHIDIQSNLQDSARENLRRASAMIMGDGGQPAQVLADEMTAVNPSEVMAKAAVEASNESGTAEHVAVATKTDEITPQRLEAEGVEGMGRFIWEHGGEPDSGPEFMLRLTAKAVEQLTGEHELPHQHALPQHREPQTV